MNKLKICILPFLIFVLLLQGCASSRPPRFNNYSNQECKHNGNLSVTERLCMFPFNSADKIQIISFSSENGKTPIEDGSIKTSKTKEIITLDSIQINELTDILYNYNYSKRLQVYSTTSNACYFPRHAIVFLDGNEKVLGYLEYCFECFGYDTNLPMESVGAFCDGKYELLKNYFSSIGIAFFDEEIKIPEPLPENPTFPVKIWGNVENMGTFCPVFPEIILFRNTDTLLITSSDVNGKYTIETSFTQGNEYSILLDVPYYKPIQLLSKRDTLVSPRTYALDFHKLLSRIDRFNPGFYFDFNALELIKYNINFSDIKCMLENNPGVCLEFVYSINSKEKKRIANKRYDDFKQQLKMEGFDLNRITFSQRLIQFPENPSIDSRSRIEAVIISLDGNCFIESDK